MNYRSLAASRDWTEAFPFNPGSLRLCVIFLGQSSQNLEQGRASTGHVRADDLFGIESP